MEPTRTPPDGPLGTDGPLGADGPLGEATRTVLSWLSRAGAPAEFGPPVDQPAQPGQPGRLRVWPLDLLPDQSLRSSDRPDPLRLRIRYLITSDAPAGLDAVLIASVTDVGDTDRDGTNSRGSTRPTVVVEPIAAQTWLALRVRPRAALMLEMPIRVGRPVAPIPLVRGPLLVRGAPMLTLRGTVLGPGDVPVPDARVRATDLGASTHTDGDGRFALPGLPAVGTTHLVVSGKGLHLSTDVAVASAQPLVLHCDFEEV